MKMARVRVRIADCSVRCGSSFNV